MDAASGRPARKPPPLNLYETVAFIVSVVDGSVALKATADTEERQL